MARNILFISHDNGLGGAERCLYDLVTRLDRDKFNPLVLVPGEGPLSRALRSSEVEVIVRHAVKQWIPYRRHTNIFYLIDYVKGWKSRYWSLLNIIARFSIDLIYTNTVTVIDGAVAARRAGIPHIWHIHEYITNNPDLRSFLPQVLVDKMVLLCANKIIVPTNIMRRARFLSAGAQVVVVPNGVDLAVLEKSVFWKKKTLNLPDSCRLVTFIGSICRTKDPETFAKAASVISSRFPDVHFVMVGESKDDEIKRRICLLLKKYSIFDRFHFLPQCSFVPALLKSASVHVSTSITESFGRTIVEAMAVGTPVVVTECGGPEELVEHGVNGFVVNARDFNAVAAAVMQLLERDGQREMFGCAGRIRVKRYYLVEQFAQKIAQVINEVSSG